MGNTRTSTSSRGSGPRRKKRQYFGPKDVAGVATTPEEPAAERIQSSSAKKK